MPVSPPTVSYWHSVSSFAQHDFVHLAEHKEKGSWDGEVMEVTEGMLWGRGGVRGQPEVTVSLG